jgi:hypothetical protein
MIAMVSSSQVAGWYAYEWQGLDQNGASVGTGIYICRLNAGEFSETIKMVFLK